MSRRGSILVSAIAVRNRITHPKLEDDITIKDEELIDAFVAWDWFHEAYGMALRGSIRRLETITSLQRGRGAM